MNGTGDGLSRVLSRRSLLASLAAAGGTAAISSQVDLGSSPDNSTRVRFEIKTLPADEDPFAIRLGRELAGWFQNAGMDVSVIPITSEELLRQVLIDNEFDAFVARFPGIVRSPDALYSLAHSAYAAEPGWHNPFGYSSLSVDDDLERQRRVDGERRKELLTRVQERLVEENPFTVLAFHDQITAHRADRFTGFAGTNLRRPREYVTIEPADPEERTLRITTTDPRVTINLNPLTPEYRRDGLITGLLYEPLAYVEEDRTVPCIASDLAWQDDDGPTARLSLRENLTWHDGEELTAEDVAFTYELYRDTSDDTGDDSVTVTRFRRRSSLVDHVTASEDGTITVHFDDVDRSVARLALTLPVLPAHVWRDRTDAAVRSGRGRTTEAIATDNVPPVGSGPLQFESISERDRLVLSRFDDHVSTSGSAGDVPSRYQDGIAFEELVVRYVGSDSSAIDLVARGEADATVSNVDLATVPRIGRNEDVDFDVTPSGSFYFAGYNVRRPPFSNVRFRVLLGRLIDRASLESSVLGGYASAAVSPLARTDWLADSLSWDEYDDRFLGEGGTIDFDRASEAFTGAGYNYDRRERLYRN